MLFAGVTLRLQLQRKRKITDASLWFWRLGLGSLVGTVSVAGSVLLLAYVHVMSLTGVDMMFS